MSKEKKDINEVDVALLHTIVDHVVSNGLAQLGIAILEAQEIFETTKDERAKELADILTTAAQAVSEKIKPIVETIPGVLMPTLGELQKMIEDAQAEKEFLKLIKTGDAVLH